MLQLVHLKKSFNKKEVLTDIDYIFNKGRLHPILGAAGSGRSTLFKCICGDLPLDSGKVKTRKRSTLFYAAKQSVLPMYITGYDFISMLCDMTRGAGKPEFYFEQVRMGKSKRDHLICDYSFEDKKRLQLAAFMVQRPYVIMFDEPLDYCSEEFMDDFIRVLNTMKEDHVILVSTGLLDVAQKISKDVIMINNGELNYISEDTMNIPEIREVITDLLGEADNELI